MNTFHAVDVALHIEIRNQGIFCYQHVEVGDMTRGAVRGEKLGRF